MDTSVTSDSDSDSEILIFLHDVTIFLFRASLKHFMLNALERVNNETQTIMRVTGN
jgi:hypothetical protein